MNRDIELLAPAGTVEKLEIGYIYGADAAYIGGRCFGLRAKAGNFSLSEMKEAIQLKERLGKKLYLTLNVFLHQQEVEFLIDYLKELQGLSFDGLIISDPGIIALAKEYLPEVPIHLSTQANTLNAPACNFWHQQGIERVVLGRETTLSEIRSIHEQTPVEIEAFIHGAMCMAYSGRCFLSKEMTGRSANSGACTHPCRWEYYVAEKKREDEWMPVEEGADGTYIFNSKDLCMLPYLDQLVDSGIKSFKIEGRMKSIHYVASVVKAYRTALDLVLKGGDFKGAVPQLMEELIGIGEREYTTGFFLDGMDPDIHQGSPNEVELATRFVGRVLAAPDEKGRLFIEQRNKFLKGDTLEVLMPYGENKMMTVGEIFNEQGLSVESAPHPKEHLYITGGEGVVANALLRLKKGDRA